MWVDNINCSGGTTYHLSPKWLAEASDRGAWRSSLRWATKFPCHFSWSHLCRVPDVSVARNNKKWVVQLIFCLDFVPSWYWNKKLKGSLEMWKCILYPKFFGFFLTVKGSYVCTRSSELNGFASVTETFWFWGSTSSLEYYGSFIILWEHVWILLQSVVHMHSVDLVFPWNLSLVCSSCRFGEHRVFPTKCGWKPHMRNPEVFLGFACPKAVIFQLVHIFLS